MQVSKLIRTFAADKLNNKLNERKDLDIRYVQLVCASEKLLQKNEDGKSLSDNDESLIELERTEFEKGYDYS